MNKQYPNEVKPMTMNFQLKMFKIGLIAIVVAAICFVGACMAQAKTVNRPTKLDCRTKAINETLSMVLLVGSDMRGQGKHPTWGEISDEVARRMIKK